MRIVVSLLALCLLTACGDSEAPPPAQPLQFTSPNYTFNVASISVAQDYKSPRHYPYVEHLADISPAKAMTQWAGVKLVSAGHDGSLEVDIKDASIVRKDLPKQKTGLEGMFTTEQTEEYDGTLDVEIKIYSPQSALPIAHLEVSAHKMLTLAEDSAPIDRERTYHQITVELMKAIEPQLDANIHQYLGKYLL